MTYENQVSTGGETQSLPPESAQETPEVAAPETAEQQPEEQKQDDEPAKALKATQRRIDRLTAARYQEQARREAAEAELQRLRAQVQPEQQQSEQVDPVQLAKEIARVERVTEKANGIAAEGEKRFKGTFGNAVAAFRSEIDPLFDSKGRPTPIGEAVLDADDPAALLHYIGSNPDIASDLVGLSPIQAARRLAKIESQINQPKEPRVSSAPKPIAPTKAGARDTGDLSDDLPPEEWRRRFLAQRAKR